MAKYFLTNKAVEDLSKIWEYTYEVWSEGQANQYYELLTALFRRLSKILNLEKTMMKSIVQYWDFEWANTSCFIEWSDPTTSKF